MAMPDLIRRWTAAEVRALPDDGNRYEVVDGELLVSPAPIWRHQRCLGRLHLLLGNYLEGRADAEVLCSPADIELDPRTLVQPDLFVVPPGRDWTDIEHLLLAVEVLSPSTARADRTVKRPRYQRAGVPEYWIVDLAVRSVEIWRPGDERPEVRSDRLSWRVDPSASAIEIDLADLFARAWQEPRDSGGDTGAGSL